MWKCSPCKKTFTGPVPFRDHVESSKHRKKIAMGAVLNNQNDASPTLADRNGAISAMHEHLSKEHAEKVMSEADVSHNDGSSNSCIIIDEIVNDASAERKSVDEIIILKELSKKKITSQLQQENENCVTAESKELSYLNTVLACEPCKKTFSGQIPYIQHLDSEAHQKKMENNTKANKIRSWFCDVCNVPCTGFVPYQHHISGSAHLKNLNRKQQSTSVAGIFPQPEQNLQYIENHMMSEVNNSLKMENNVKANSPWFCSICNVSCTGYAPYRQHISGSAHLKKLNRKQQDTSVRGISPQSMQQSTNANGVISLKMVNVNDQQLMDQETDTYILPELTKVNCMSIAEMEESVTVFLPNDTIDFDKATDKMDVDSTSEKAAWKVPENDMNTNDAMKTDQTNGETKTKLKAWHICNSAENIDSNSSRVKRRKLVHP